MLDFFAALVEQIHADGVLSWLECASINDVEAVFVPKDEEGINILRSLVVNGTSELHFSLFRLAVVTHTGLNVELVVGDAPNATFIKLILQQTNFLIPVGVEDNPLDVTGRVLRVLVVAGGMGQRSR